MRTKIGYSNDQDFDYWNIEVSTNSEESFHKLLEAMQDSLEDNEISVLGCPWESEDVYGDSFAIDKEYMTKGEFMKVMRKILKDAKKSIK